LRVMVVEPTAAAVAEAARARVVKKRILNY